MRRIGVVGGTFDPPHVGHLSLAACAHAQLGLDQVLLIPANDPWQKSGSRKVTPAPERLAMVELAVSSRSEFAVSAMEIRRGGPTYSIDTVNELRASEVEGGLEVVLVLGSDAAGDLDTWHRSEELKGLVSVAVAERPGALADRPPQGWQWSVLDMPRVRVSSSELRDRMRRDASVDFLVPDSVLHYAVEAGLYS